MFIYICIYLILYLLDNEDLGCGPAALNSPTAELSIVKCLNTAESDLKYEVFFCPCTFFLFFPYLFYFCPSSPLFSCSLSISSHTHRNIYIIFIYMHLFIAQWLCIIPGSLSSFIYCLGQCSDVKHFISGLLPHTQLQYLHSGPPCLGPGFFLFLNSSLTGLPLTPNSLTLLSLHLSTLFTWVSENKHQIILFPFIKHHSMDSHILSGSNPNSSSTQKAPNALPLPLPRLCLLFYPTMCPVCSHMDWTSF